MRQFAATSPLGSRDLIRDKKVTFGVRSWHQLPRGRGIFQKEQDLVEVTTISKSLSKLLLQAQVCRAPQINQIHDAKNG